MRDPIPIKQWLPNQELNKWVKKAPGVKAYRRRLAIRLKQVNKMSTEQVALILSVSEQTIWLWTKRYNKLGPKKYDFKVRGGRRNAIFTLKEEKELVRKFISDFKKGKIQTIKEWSVKLNKYKKDKLSEQFAYKLLNRHGVTAQKLKKLVKQ